MSDNSLIPGILSKNQLPNGWIICKFGDLFDIKGGTQPPKSEFSQQPQPGYVRLLQIRDFESEAKKSTIKNSARRTKKTQPQQEESVQLELGLE